MKQVELRFSDPRDRVELANERVPLRSVMAKYGVNYPELELGVSMKIQCPWGMLHSDGGVDPAMRVYAEENHAFCFAGCGRITPVRLEAEQRGIPFAQAASELLHDYNIKPLTWTERIERLREDGPVRVGDPGAFAQALVTYIRSVLPAGGEYDEAVITFIDEALKELPTSPDYSEWLRQWKSKAETKFSL